MQFYNKSALSLPEIIVKGQDIRISGSQFLKWLFGPEKFTRLWRNGPQPTKEAKNSNLSCMVP